MARSVIALIVAFLTSAAAFVSKNGAARSMVKAGLSMKMDFPKAVAALTPAIIAGPAFASMDAVSSMPVSLEVTFAAYLAVLLGTFVPVTFLIVLYSQSEARKAGARSAK